MVLYLTHEIFYRDSNWEPLTVSDKRENHITTLNITYFAMQSFDGKENWKKQCNPQPGGHPVNFWSLRSDQHQYSPNSIEI